MFVCLFVCLIVCLFVLCVFVLRCFYDCLFCVAALLSVGFSEFCCLPLLAIYKLSDGFEYRFWCLFGVCRNTCALFPSASSLPWLTSYCFLASVLLLALLGLLAFASLFTSAGSAE